MRCIRNWYNSGFQFKWTFEEAIKDWFEDNAGKGLE